jgi:hypothetical protein
MTFKVIGSNPIEVVRGDIMGAKSGGKELPRAERGRAANYGVALPPSEMLRLMRHGGAAPTVEEVEAQGQRELIAANGASLPIKGSDNPVFVRMGFVFGLPLDKFFREAKMPMGWKIQPSNEHVMRSDILDSKGRRRVRVHYRALLTARMARMEPTVRYTAEIEYQGEFGRPGESNRGFVFDHSTRTEVFSTKTLRREGLDRKFLRIEDLRAETSAWLATHFPEHQNPEAYWD